MADGTEIIVADAPRAALTPMELLDRALDRGADIGVLEKLMDLQERHDKTQARRAFDSAVANAKADIGPIHKNRTGHNNKRYADFSAYAKAIDPVLAANGLSYRFRTEQSSGAISVTCILAHRDGHSEETTLVAGADTTGNKNSIQAIGSTVTYLQRYTLSAQLGLAATEDDDGQSADGDEPISGEQLTEIRAKVESSGTDIEKFCRYLQVDALPDIRKKDYPKALAAIAQKMKAKKTGGAP
ncbi:MAG: ERF family protein [Hyphomonadaceae bacterium]